MEINFTKREYRTLLEMLHLANWMLHAHETGNKKGAYHALEQKILSLADKFGSENLVEYCEHLNQYFTTKAFEEDAVQGHIKEYDNDTFWDELVSRLARRDIFRKYTEEELAGMTVEDRVTLFWQAETPYAEEFETNGLDRITIE